MKTLLKIIGYLAICIGVGFLVGKGMALLKHGEVDDMKMLMSVGLALASLIVGAVANTILHEAGHLVGGLLTGYRFLSFRVFKYTLVKDEGGWQWKQFNINGTAGQCLMVPPAVESEEQLPYFWYNVGGVLVNLVIVVVSGALLAFCNMHFVPLALCMMLLVSGAYLLILNAIPMNPGGVPNDGMNILTLWRHPEQRGCFSRMMNVVASQSFGKRLSDMPEEWFVNEPLPEEPSVMQISDRSIYLCWLYDNLRFDESRKVAEEIMGIGKRLPQLFRMEIASDRLFLELATSNRAEIVAELWDKKQEQYVRHTAKYMPMKHATLFAYELISRNNPEEAQKHYDEVVNRQDKYSQPGEAKTAIAAMDFVKEHRN